MDGSSAGEQSTDQGESSGMVALELKVKEMSMETTTVVDDGLGAESVTTTTTKVVEAEMRPVMCVCGVLVSVPVDVFLFQCSSCKETVEIPKPLTEEDKRKLARRALNRWMVREAVSRELDLWLDGKETFSKESNSIVARFYRRICSFPLFDDKSSGIDEALLDFFMFLPKLEEKLVKMGDRRTSVRQRFVNYIAGPIFYATFGDETESGLFSGGGSRGEKNDAFKTDLAGLLREVEKPDGAATILEALESAHSIMEIPGGFRRMAQSHVESAVANLEHSLAKPRGRSKLKSLYRLTPRRAIIKLMKLHMGPGLATSAINLFMVKPFGRRSLMQRMCATTLGVGDSEMLAGMAAKHLTPEVKARCLAYIANYDGEHGVDLWYSTDAEILYFLGCDEVTKSTGCPPVPGDQIETMRLACDVFNKGNEKIGTSVSFGDSTGYEKDDSGADESGFSSGEEDEYDVDREFEVTEDGKVSVKQSGSSSSSSPKASSSSLSSSFVDDPIRKTKSFFKRKKKIEKTMEKRHPLEFVRMFCYEELNSQVGDTIVELLGDESLERFVRVSLPIIQGHFISTVGAKGSGMIPLLEGLFAAWKRVLKVNKNNKIPLAMKRLAYTEVVQMIHELVFTLIHNLVRGDKTRKWHELLFWLVDMWNSSKVEMDTDSMLNKLSEEDRKKVDEEAEVLRVYHLENATRSLGTDNLPPPKIEAASKLVHHFREEIINGLFQGEEKDVTAHIGEMETQSSRVPPKRLQAGDLKSREDELFVTQIEVVYSYEDVSSMHKRGYECLEIDFNIAGQSDTKSRLWVRRSLPEHAVAQDGTPLEWMKPITDIRIVETNENVEASLRQQGYIKVAKPIDKRNFYLWYTRAESDSIIANVSAIRLDDSGAKLRQQALQATGYALLAPVIKSMAKNFFGQQITKASVGVYVLKKQVQSF